MLLTRYQSALIFKQQTLEVQEPRRPSPQNGGRHLFIFALAKKKNRRKMEFLSRRDSRQRFLDTRVIASKFPDRTDLIA